MGMGKGAEKVVRQRLEKVLGDLGFEIRHGVYTIAQGQQIDILIFHRDLGVWLVGVRSYLDDPEEVNEWLDNIREARDAFLDYLKSLGLRGKVWAGMLLALPNTTKEEYTEMYKSPVKLDHALVLFKEDFKDIDRLRQKLLNRMRKMVEDEDISWESVLAFFSVVPKRLSVNPQKYICFLDDVQADIIDRLHDIGFGYTLIRGGAGTGKTWLILKILERIDGRIRKKLKALVMCFNQNLYDFFKEEIEKLNLKKLDVDVERIPLRGGSGFPLAKQDLDNILGRNYNFILCDEVQDYHKEAVETILDKCDNVALFCDDAQRIYVQSRWKWDDLKEYSLDDVILTTVYRSPSKIFKAGVEILKLDNGLKNDYGEYIDKVLKSSTVNRWGGLYFVRKIDEDFIRKVAKKFSNRSISVLFPHWGYSGTWDEVVSYSDTYLRSKGLEFDIVLLKDFWDFLEKWTRRKTPEFLYTRAYTSITRGRFFVFVEELPSQDYSDEVKQIYRIMKKYSVKRRSKDVDG